VPARLLITDGVFSMEGEIGPLRELATSATATRRRSSSTTRTRPGSSARRGAARRSTSPFVTGSRSTLRRSGRPWARPRADSSPGRRPWSSSSASGRGPPFSPTRSPRRRASSLEAFRMLMEDPSPARKLQQNALSFRKKMTGGRLHDPKGIHPIVPVLVGDTAKALAMSDALSERRLRLGLRLPRRAARAREAPLPDLGGPYRGRPRRGGGGVQGRRAGVRRDLTPPTARPRSGSGPRRSGRRSPRAGGRTAQLW